MEYGHGADMNKVNITDLTLRDAHQCLIATRLRTEDMLPICSQLDDIGFWALEVWGGATFDACLRFLKEDPWLRLSQLRAALPKTKLSMLLRGQNLLGYRHYADDVVEEFILETCKTGIDVFRIFDALNDIRNLEKSIDVVKQGGKHAQGTICYTTSPVHKIEQFVEMGKELQKMGCDSIAIKDMAGLLTPSVTDSLIKALLDATTLPIHLHSHSTSGLASICHYKAVEAGCRHIDTAISAFAEGASHPCTESMVAAFMDTHFDSQLDLIALQKIGDYFRKVRKKYVQFESEATAIDPRVQIFQVPGGMISNLYNQLKEQGALDKLPQVHEEIPKVRKDLGYPPLVTPTSQVVGTQAVLHVLTGESYKSITNEVKLYCQGKYGLPPTKIDAVVKQKAIGNTDVIDCRPADVIPHEFKKLEKEIGGAALSKQDVLSYAMFPDVGKSFLQERADGSLVPEALIPAASDQAISRMPDEFDVSIHGDNYHVCIKGAGNATQMEQPFFITLDGVPEEVIVHALNGQSALAPSPNQSSRPRAETQNDVTVAMPSTIVSLSVKENDQVQAGDVILVTEARKMETEIQAPISGKISNIYCQKGDLVNPNETLIRIE